jgi:toxin HigB-1
MIRGFRDKKTGDAFKGLLGKGFPSDLIKIVRRKLGYLNAAALLSDLKVPPGNHLELLKGDRAGQHSIRVNDRYRICFIWTDEGPIDVEFTDYH